MPRYMQLSRIRNKIKKPSIIGLFIVVSFIVCFYSLHITGGKISPLFSETLKAFMILAGFGTTMSLFLITYADGISKELSTAKKDENKKAAAVEMLSELKKEVVVNACFIITLFIIELAAKGVSDSFQDKAIPFEGFEFTLLALRFVIFMVAILAVVDQIRGLLVAFKCKKIIHLNSNAP